MKEMLQGTTCKRQHIPPKHSLSTEEFEKVYKFNKQARLPICLKDIDVNSKEDLTVVLDKAMTTNDIVHVPYKITRDMVYDAIMQLEAYYKQHN